LEEVEPVEVDREHSETCVEKEECLPLSRLGEDGIERSISSKEDMLLLPLLLPVDVLH
jgi:hypothetical protein